MRVTSTDDARVATYRDVTALPGVGRLLLAALFGRLAEQMFSLALVLFVLQRVGSPELAGVAVFASIAPGLVTSPIAGALLDRRPSATLIAGDMAFSGALIAALVVLDVAGLLGAAPLLILVSLYSLTSPLSLAGTRALLPRLVPAHALDRANALDTTIWAVVGLVGPLAVGALFALAGAAPALGVIAASYALGWLVLAPLRSAGVGGGSAEAPRGIRGSAVEGVRYVLRTPTLRGIAASYSLYQGCWGVLTVAVPVIVIADLGRGGDAPTVVGALWAASGVAGGIGALVVGRIGTSTGERRLIAAGTAMTGVVVLAFASLGVLPLAIALVAAGALGGAIDLGVLALRQRRTDPARLGRVLAVSISFNSSGAPIGAALGGLLLAQSVVLAVVTAGVAAILSGVAALALIPAREPSPLVPGDA